MRKLLTDAEIIRAVLDGNRGQFALLVQRYEKAVHAMALHLLRDFDASEDAAQEAFVSAYENLGSLRNPARFGPWLLQIARNKALTGIRRRPQKTAPLEAAESVPDEAPDPRVSESSRQVLAAVMQLPENERQAVLMKHFDGQTATDIAALTGRSVGTITKQLSRAYARLRKRLKEYGS